ncbi:hypothetical protein [Helicobacter sp. 23-1045]
MTLKFTFFYSDLNKDYFLGLLQKIAQNFGLEVCVEFSDKTLDFYASGENLGDFASALTKEIPLSLYFRFKSVEVCEAPKHLKPLQIAESAENILSVSQINARKFLQDSAMESALKNLCDLLKQGDEITLNTSKGAILLSTKKGDLRDSQGDLQGDSQKHDSHDSRQNFDFILANDISTISLYTRASQDEINAIATLEKPLINLSVKEVFYGEVGAKNALFILPFEANLCFIFSALEVPFLFAKRADSADKFFEIIVGKNGAFVENNIAKSKNFDEFLAMNFTPLRNAKNAESDIFIAYISAKNPTLLGNPSDKISHTKIAFDKNPKNILAKISHLENGDKLIANFAREFGARYEAILALDSAPKFSENIIDIFECAAMILGAESNNFAESRTFAESHKNAESHAQFILDLAKNCLRDISPKIDFKNIGDSAKFAESPLDSAKKISDSANLDSAKKTQDSAKNAESPQDSAPKTYDELKTIRSIISFTLAGTEREIIAYGILESLVDYVLLNFRDIKRKFGVKKMGIIGDLFANKIFFDKITKKIPADLDLILPTYLDFKR